MTLHLCGAPAQGKFHNTPEAVRCCYDGTLCGELASGKLGQHNGLPASSIVTTTPAELETAAGRALPSGGSIPPMSDVIRRGLRDYVARQGPRLRRRQQRHRRTDDDAA